MADAYDASQKIITGLLNQNNHLVTRVRSNAVAYTRYHHQGAKKRGRPRVYGKKIALKSRFGDGRMEQTASPVYGEKNVTLQYRACDLLWRPVGRPVRFVVVIHPTRGRGQPKKLLRAKWIGIKLTKTTLKESLDQTLHEMAKATLLFE